MKTARELLLAWTAASFLWLVPVLLAPPPPASAQGVNSWEGAEETVDTPAAAFLREHGRQVFIGAAVVLFVLFGYMIGPVGRAPRRHFGGFGTNGGFGGNLTTKNPWL